MSRRELEKIYDPTSVEDRWYAYWEENHLFHADAASPKPTYTIMIPPPNVTGMLTMGHILNNTMQDLLIRWKKMQGYETLWMPGTDHAGIATQNKVEAALRQDGELTRHTLGREEFLEARLGVEGKIRRHHFSTAAQARRLLRLGTRMLHHG